MRSAWLWALALCLGCSSGSAGVRGRSAEMCLWPESGWDDQGALRVRGSTVKLGRAHRFWSNGAWHGAFVAGSLKQSPRGLVFEGEWQAHGLRVFADALVTEDTLFTAWNPARIGSAAVLTRGTPLRLLDARPGEVLVTPSVRAVDGLVTPEPLLVTLRCEDLSLSAQVQDDGSKALRAAGFRHDAAPVRFKAQDAVVLLDAPAGRPVGAARPDVAGFMLAKQADAVRVAAVRDGVVLVGWAPASKVEAVVPLASEAAPERAAEAPSRSGLAWRECDEEVPVHVFDGEGLGARVGVIEAGQRFATRMRSPVSRASVVVIESSWFDADAALVFLTPTDLSRCSSVIGPW